MANYREEHIRNNRRLARQIVGGAALLLALIGLFTVLGWVIGLVRSALDDSSLRDEYHDRLYGMVMLDPVAFDDVSTVDEGVFKQAAIWGTVYQVQNSGGSLDQYERDPDTGSALIPALEIVCVICERPGECRIFTVGHNPGDIHLPECDNKVHTPPHQMRRAHSTHK